MKNLSIRQALQTAQGHGLDRLDAQLLLLHILGRPLHDRAWLLAHDTDELSAPHATAFEALAQRRLHGEPVAYITGVKEFHGLDLKVNPSVLVPRPDTETLVDWALELLEVQCDARVIDLGCGSGAIALALARARPTLEVHALDVSAAALQVAQDNAKRLGLQVHWHHGSWFSGLQRGADMAGVAPGSFQLIVSNPPYIAEGDAHLAHLTHEPMTALTSGPDGLRDLRLIIEQAPHWLAPGGWLLLEHGYDQAAAVRACLHAQGFEQVQSRTDLAGVDRCTGARRARACTA